MVGESLVPVGAARTSKGTLRTAAAALLVAGVLGSGLALLGATSAGAIGIKWFAYAAGGATSPSICPETSTVSVQCTLSQALGLAGDGDTVALATPAIDGHYDGNFSIGTDITLQPGADVVDPVLDGDGGSGPVLTVDPAVTATVNGVTVTGGTNTTDSGFDATIASGGGGIQNLGTLTLSDSTVSGNEAFMHAAIAGTQAFGGGIYNDGSIVVEDSTVSGNVAESTDDLGTAFGGGILNDEGGNALVEDSTVSGNSAVASGIISDGDGGGIGNTFFGGVVTVEASTIADNSVSGTNAGIGAGLFNVNTSLAATIVADNTGAAECLGTSTDNGYNVDDDGSCGLSAPGSVSDSPAIDTYLGSLSSNGGPTETIPLEASPTSPLGPDPALNAIPSSFDLPSGPAACSLSDQRGVPRSAPCDMGAYETHPVNVATTTQLAGTATAVAPGTDVTFSATVTPTTDNEGGSAVDFFDNGSAASCSGYTFNGQLASCTLNFSTPGTYSVQAFYTGDTVFAGSSFSNPWDVTVSPNPTTTSLTASTTTPNVGDAVTYTATVTPTPDAGSVAFSDDGTPVVCGAGSTSLTSGVATCSVSYASAGSHTVIATYSGDSAYGMSVSNPVGVAVTKTATTTSLAASNTEPASNEADTLTATVSPSQVGGAPGTVSFSDNGNPIACGAGSQAFNGTSATCVTSFAAAGTHQEVATYSGDTAANGSSSVPVLVAVAVPNHGYRVAASDGGVFSFDAPFAGSIGGQTLDAPIVGMASDPATGGYWLVARDGGVFGFNAPFLGSMGGKPLNAPIVGMAADASGGGYWLVAADGGIFTYGNAGFFGSTGGMALNKPIVGMAPDPGTGGYWLVASDGGIFGFNAPFHGSMGGKALNAPIAGMAADPGGGGYWLVGSDGGVFTFGDATFYGSAGGDDLASPVVGIATDPNTGGYWILAANGAIIAYGAPDDGQFVDLGAVSHAVAISAG